MTYAETLKNLLKNKKGTQANRDATAKSKKTMLDLGKQFTQMQNNAPTNAIIKNAPRGVS